MVWSTLCKLLQKQTYDVLSHRYGTYLLTGGIILVIVSGFQFGEVALEWSQEKYAAVFNSFSDNLSGKSYQGRLCLPVPIDIVYTWVNGSDPKLLAELRHFKAEMELELNETRSLSDASGARCPFPHCLLSLAVVADPTLPPSVDAEKLAAANPVLGRSVRMTEVRAPSGDNNNVTVFFFSNAEDAKAASEETISVEGHNFTFHAAYYTSDWTLANAVLLPDTLLMTGFPHSLTPQQLLEKLPDKFNKANVKLLCAYGTEAMLPIQIRLYESEGMAVMEVPMSTETDDLLHTSNFTIDAKEPTLNSASLIWDMQDVRYNEEMAASRFADNEELRYSLRSIQTFAPWVRHVYLVTNGQIPAWLNLDNPRLTVVTHEEIFPNRSHLPAFASPAIESHLHRIPGLSDKFIYMNDDVMFGKEVWPDDFFTHAHGQKIYLTWPVPNCQDGCPSSWIRDGYCDKACNNSECEWDGGDCAGGAPNTFSDHDMGPVGEWNANNEAMYCSSGCANNWVADRYCDQSCNVKECGFDAGDCGIANFDKLTRIDLQKNVTTYKAPKGETVLYVNVTAMFGDDVTLEEGTFEENPIVRTATLAQKFKTLNVILFENKNASTLHFYIKGKLNDTEIEYSFDMLVDSTAAKEVSSHVIKVKVEDGEETIHNLTSSSENSPDGKAPEPLHFEDIPEELLKPQSVKSVADENSDRPAGSVPDDLSEFELDVDTETSWKHLQMELDQGDLTKKGFEMLKITLWADFVKKLGSRGEVPHRAALRVLQNADAAADNGNKLQILQLGQVGQKVEQPDNVRHKETAEGIENTKFDQYLQSKQQLRSKKESLEVFNPGHEVVQEEGGGAIVRDAPLRARQQRPVSVAGLQAPAWPDHRGNVEPAGQVRQMYQDAPGRQLPGGPHMEKMIVKRLDEIERTAGDKHAAAASRDENQKPHAPAKSHGENYEQNHNGPVKKMENVKDEQGADAGQNTKGSNHRSRKLTSVDLFLTNDLEENYLDLPPKVDAGDRLGFLPWEKQRVFAALQKRHEAAAQRRTRYQSAEGGTRRHLLDTFGDSLRHVNRLYNMAYGYSARKVPAHMPHFIDRQAMYDLQARFPKEWDETSSHRIRSSTDMQFAFSYMYFIVSEPKPTTVGDIFEELDNDHSGVLSDRELRTMATRLYELPLDLQTLTGLEQMIINCSKHLPPVVTFTWGRQTEVYYDKSMPQVTKTLINNCNPIIELIQKNFKGRTRFRHEVVDDSEIAFKMIHTNVSQVVGQLDDIRRNPKKFICLNDNMDHSKEEAKTVKAVLLDFYESILPAPSDFELPREYRNRFLHTDELREWRKYRDWLKLWTQVALGVLILFTIGSFFADKFSVVRRRFFRPRAASQYDDPSKGDQAAAEGRDPGSGGAGRPDQAGGRPPDVVHV